MASTHFAARVTVFAPAPEEALRIVDAGIGEFNARRAPLGDVQPLHVIAHDDTDTTVGGAVGRTWGRCCELQQLWVAAEHRQQGIGSRLLEAFEREATARGCTLIYLDTFSFQAPAFYALRGYDEAFRVTGFARDVAKLTLQKKIGAYREEGPTE